MLRPQGHGPWGREEGEETRVEEEGDDPEDRGGRTVQYAVFRLDLDRTHFLEECSKKMDHGSKNKQWMSCREAPA